MRQMTLAAAGSLALFLCGVAWAGEGLAGKPAVVEGDTLHLHGTVVGLFGIAAPGPDQICETAAGTKIRCGVKATRALAAHIGEARVACEPRGVDRHHRTLAICRLGKEDLSAWMVANGYAVADRFNASDYRPLETEAWAKRRGLWAGVFEDPTERKRGDYAAAGKRTAMAE